MIYPDFLSKDLSTKKSGSFLKVIKFAELVCYSFAQRGERIMIEVIYEKEKEKAEGNQAFSGFQTIYDRLVKYREIKKSI